MCVIVCIAVLLALHLEVKSRDISTSTASHTAELIGQTVYITKNGSKYHLNLECPYVRGKDNLTTMDIKDAEKQYGLCSYCERHYA